MNSRIKLDIWWDGLAPYAAACWRELAQQSNIDLHIIAIRLPTSSNTSFDPAIIDGLPISLVTADELSAAVNDRISQKPQIVAMTGWARKPYRTAAPLLRTSGAKVFVMIDTPWRSSWKQRIGLILLRRFAKHFHGAIVPGERSWQYAIRLGFVNRPIYKSLYSVDDTLLSKAYSRRQGLAAWPKRFLFVGRLVNDKGVDTLQEGYAVYRKLVDMPWSLTCVGMGPEAAKLSNQAGIELVGFKQPNEMLDLWAEHGTFVLPSRFDPWPLSIVEAARTGLPIIHSSACGSAVENVRDNFNGFSFTTGNAVELGQALATIHHRYGELPEFGERSRVLASPYTAKQWALNWSRIADQTIIPGNQSQNDRLN